MRWLFLVHQIHPQPSQARVKIWRALKKVGAVLHRNSVYVLPASKDCREDFAWLSQQIRDSGGQASVFLSEALSDAEDRELMDQFREARNVDYGDLFTRLRRLEHRCSAAQDRTHQSARRQQRLLAEWEELKQQFDRIHRVDFFEAPQSRPAQELLRRLRKNLHEMRQGKSAGAESGPRSYRIRDYLGKSWVTRRDLHVDRLASGWLIRRFIDPQARFVYAPEKRIPRGPIPFDCFGADLSHHGEDCTFETFIKRFQLRGDPALGEIAQIVHDIDLKDDKYGRTETAGMDLVIQALCTTIRNDEERMIAGQSLFNSLYEHLRRTPARAAGKAPARK